MGWRRQQRRVKHTDHNKPVEIARTHYAVNARAIAAVLNSQGIRAEFMGLSERYDHGFFRQRYRYFQTYPNAVVVAQRDAARALSFLNDRVKWCRASEDFIVVQPCENGACAISETRTPRLSRKNEILLHWILFVIVASMVVWVGLMIKSLF